MSRGSFIKQRHRFSTVWLGNRATRSEGTSAGFIERGRHLSLEMLSRVTVTSRNGLRDRRDQRSRIGMNRCFVNAIRISHLNKFAEIHHRDTIANVVYD